VHTDDQQCDPESDPDGEEEPERHSADLDTPAGSRFTPDVPHPGKETLPRGLRGSLTTGCALVVLFAVLVPASGAGVASPGARRDDTPPYGGKNPPSGKSTAPACSEDVRPADPAIKQKFPGGQSPTGDVCGSFRDDTITVTDTHGGGTEVWAGPGNDTVNTQNHRVDEILGGPGKNSATVDACLPDGKIFDHTVDVAHVKKKKVKCTDVTLTRRVQAGAAPTYPYDEPDILCTVSTNGKRLVSVAREPTMRAVDATANVDWQTVAFSALLYTWNGTSYVFSQQSQWMQDRVPDEQLLDFGPNFWRPFDSPSHQQIFFNPGAAGRYRVAIRYHWYAANGTDDHDILDWASYHFGHYGSAGQGFCNFPGPPPPDGHYAGTTDENRAISFDAAAIWPNAPREIGGSRLTNVRIASSLSCTPARPFNYVINVDAGRWIQLNADNTFAFERVGTLNDPARQNVVASYFLAGRIDTAGIASGSVYFQQLSFDENGTHYTCAGAAHTWTAKPSG